MSAVHCRVTPSNLLHFKCCLFIAILAGATHAHQKFRLLQHSEFVSLWDFGNCCLKLGFQPARNPGRISDQPGRDFSQPGTNCSQPGCNASLLGRTLGVGPGCTSCNAHDTWLLTSRILHPPWVLGLPGLLLSLPGSPWAPRAPWVWVLGLGLVPKYLPGLLSGVPRTWPLPWAPGFLVLVPWSLVLVPGGCKNQYSS